MTNMHDNIAMMRLIFPSFTLREAGVAYACIAQLTEHITNEVALMQHHYTDVEMLITYAQ
ncbi:MAG: hypothetical protein EAY65_00125 [Alphaproteobacteria bacterium]|nr:MAG: hypothetical protein EAY65_00125 [Alphaproteobacteria bacterium]